MTILIDNKSGQPIYEQIVEQIREQILTGALGADEALPSIRSLAKDLRISVITTKRAYEELEQEGFLYTVAGKGCFVAEKNTELLREEDLRRIEEHLSEIRRLAARCGLTRAELREMLEIMEEDEA
ncbi:MAG: GntR family transcriptional regulator [Eubacteriales bacterium]|nr:GntR family transcriptional regulator [Eubacteriales bacterium]